MEFKGDSYKVNIWDTTGQEKFSSLTNTYFRGCSGVLLTCDMSSLEHIPTIDFWYNEMKDHMINEVPKILVGTKGDMMNEVSEDVLGQIAEKKEMSWILTSAKNNQNIEEAFILLLERVIEHKKELIKEDNKEEVVVQRLNGNAPLQKKKKCC